MQVPQVVQAGMRQCQRDCRDRRVMSGDELVHERRHGVWVKRLAPLSSEDKAVVIGPGRASRLPFLCLAAAVIAENRNGVPVNADHAGPAAIGGSLDPPTAYNLRLSRCFPCCPR